MRIGKALNPMSNDIGIKGLEIMVATTTDKQWYFIINIIADKHLRQILLLKLSRLNSYLKIRLLYLYFNN